MRWKSIIKEELVWYRAEVTTHLRTLFACVLKPEYALLPLSSQVQDCVYAFDRRVSINKEYLMSCCRGIVDLRDKPGVSAAL